MIIDADGHYTPSPDIFLAEPALKVWSQQYDQRKRHSYSSIDQRDQELTQLGLTQQLLNPMGVSLGIDYLISTADARHVARIYNQHLHSLCHHASYDWNIWLPLQDPELALEELHRYDPAEYFAIFLGEKPQWGFIPDMNPIWAYASQHRIPLYLHQTHMRDDLPRDRMWATLSARLETLFEEKEFWLKTLASLLCSDVFDRFDDLRFVIAERDIDWIRPFLDRLKQAGLGDHESRMRQNFWFTIEPEMPHFLDSATWIGWDRLLFATDWPHDRDMGGRNSRKDVQTIQDLDLGQQQKEKIFSQNYLNLRQRH
jgi:predicted TIM-barrel fold metal-dependent hydrolase